MEGPRCEKASFGQTREPTIWATDIAELGGNSLPVCDFLNRSEDQRQERLKRKLFVFQTPIYVGKKYRGNKYFSYAFVVASAPQKISPNIIIVTLQAEC